MNSEGIRHTEAVLTFLTLAFNNTEVGKFVSEDRVNQLHSIYQGLLKKRKYLEHVRSKDKGQMKSDSEDIIIYFDERTNLMTITSPDSYVNFGYCDGNFNFGGDSMEYFGIWARTTPGEQVGIAVNSTSNLKVIAQSNNDIREF